MPSLRALIVSSLSLLAFGVVADASSLCYTRGSAPTLGSAPGSVKKQKYRCPMHPQVIQEHPGKCPICCMKLVPAATPSKPTQPSCGVAEGGSCGPTGACDTPPQPIH